MSWNPGKQLKRWTVGSAFGFKKASPLNPYTHGFWTAKKVVNGFKRGTWAKNTAKTVGLKPAGVSSAASYGSSYGVYGPTGSIVGRY